MDSEKVFDPDSLDRKSYQNVGLLFGPIIFILNCFLVIIKMLCP